MARPDDAEVPPVESGDLGDREDRHEQRARMRLEQLQARGVMPVVGIDVGVQRSGIDQDRDERPSCARISSIRSETSC